MSIKVKRSGAYEDALGVYVKRNGVYALAVDVFTKIAGVYASAGGGVLAAWSALRISASQIVKGSAGRLDGITCVAGSNITLTVYDNPWTASGTVLYTGTLSAGQSASLSSVPLYCIDGLYASFSGTATFDFQIGE